MWRDRPGGLRTVGRRDLELGLQRDAVRVCVDQPNVVLIFFSQSFGDIEAQCRDSSRSFDGANPTCRTGLDIMPEEKLPDQRVDLIVANGSRRRNCCALDLLANRGSSCGCSAAVVYVGKKLRESAHWNHHLWTIDPGYGMTQDRRLRRGSQASTGTSSRP